MFKPILTDWLFGEGYVELNAIPSPFLFDKMCLNQTWPISSTLKRVVLFNAQSFSFWLISSVFWCSLRNLYSSGVCLRSKEYAQQTCTGQLQWMFFTISVTARTVSWPPYGADLLNWILTTTAWGDNSRMRDLKGNYQQQQKWTLGLRILSDQSCTWGMIHNKSHLISLGWPWSSIAWVRIMA